MDPICLAFLLSLQLINNASANNRSVVLFIQPISQSESPKLLYPISYLNFGENIHYLLIFFAVLPTLLSWRFTALPTFVKNRGHGCHILFNNRLKTVCPFFICRHIMYIEEISF